MSVSDFLNQLKLLGYEATDLGGGKIYIHYQVPIGRFAGLGIRLGFLLPVDFPISPPSGPHISPRLLPINAQQGPHPGCGVHESPFGPEWEYWSRPMRHWTQTKRTVKDVFAHFRHLLDTQ